MTIVIIRTPPKKTHSKYYRAPTLWKLEVRIIAARPPHPEPGLGGSGSLGV